MYLREIFEKKYKKYLKFVRKAKENIKLIILSMYRNVIKINFSQRKKKNSF